MPKLTSGCLVLGLGNPFLGDDHVGHRVAESLNGRLAARPGLTVRATSFSGIRLLDQLIGYERVILVDSIITGSQPPGSLHVLGISDTADGAPPVSVHHFSVAQLLELGRRCGLQVPRRLTIYAIEIEPPAEVGEGLSPAIEAAVERVTREILLREFPEQAAEIPFPCREENSRHGLLCR